MRYLLFFGMLAGSVFTFAQTDTVPTSVPARTLFKSDYKVGVTAAFLTDAGRFDEQGALFMGGAAGVVLNRKYTVGGYGTTRMNAYSVSVPNSDETQPGVTYQVDFSHYGFWFKYDHNPEKLFHFYGSLKFGTGKIRYENNRLAQYSNNVFFATIPAIGADLNVTDIFRLGVNLGYQHISGYTDGDGLINTGKISTPLFGVSLTFGYFGD